MNTSKTITQELDKWESQLKKIKSKPQIQIKKEGETHRILEYIMTKYNLKEFTIINQTRVAEALNIQQQAVSRTIQRLILWEILIEGKKVDKSRYYKLTGKTIESINRGIRANQSKNNKTETVKDQ